MRINKAMLARFRGAYAQRFPAERYDVSSPRLRKDIWVTLRVEDFKRLAAQAGIAVD